MPPGQVDRGDEGSPRSRTMVLTVNGEIPCVGAFALVISHTLEDRDFAIPQDHNLSLGTSPVAAKDSGGLSAIHTQHHPVCT